MFYRQQPSRLSFNMIYFYKRNKTYLTLFASLILATLSTRLINQIDLSMMNQISSKSSSALILINKITFIDFIFAFTFVPVGPVIMSPPTDFSA